MYDKELALDSLSDIESALTLIVERAAVAVTPDDDSGSTMYDRGD